MISHKANRILISHEANRIATYFDFEKVYRLPNRFLALVPRDFDPWVVETAIRDEWNNIAARCFSFLDRKNPLPAGVQNAWAFQAEQFLKIDWYLHPWEPNEKTLDSVAHTGSAVGRLVKRLEAAANQIPDKDKRCYPLNPGVFWSAHYDLASQALDGRRACRDFSAWENHSLTRERDAFSGREEAVIDAEWVGKAHAHPTLKHLFRSTEKLGAVNLIKRVWHIAVLEEMHGLKRRHAAFDSVYAVAAGAWKAKVKERLSSNQDCWLNFLQFASAAGAASAEQSVMEQVPPPPSRNAGVNETDWLERLDAELLTQRGWLPATSSPEKEGSPVIREAQHALQRFLKSAGMNEPTAYYAVLALDGDKVGEWLSGKNNPVIRSLLSPEAVSYFEGFPEGRAWLETNRPLSPSFHLGFSEALSNFGLYAAAGVVEAHHGQLIYSGGDDVLAMVPAEEAVRCAEGLRLAFQGSPALSERYPAVFRKVPSHGLIHLRTDGREGVPDWPLLVPGRAMSVSAGIAIGHAKVPLQDMIEEAREAEKRAKRDPASGGLGRNALAVSLLKRSGEILLWGTPFESPSLELLLSFQQLYRADVLPGTFGQRVPQLVDRFDPGGNATVTIDLADLIRAEVRWSWNQLEGGSRSKRAEAEASFFDTLDRCLDGLVERRAPVSEFTRLFGVETFLKRHTA